MNIDTFALECFLAVSETKSFTKAAQKLGRTQSAVSQQIAKFESLVGKPLFDRKNHLLFTEEGEIIHGYAKKILNLHLQLANHFNEPNLEGQLKFGLPEDFATFLLTDVLVEFSRYHPQLKLNIECDLTLNLYERFKRKEFDMVLLKMSTPESFPNGVEVLSEELSWVGEKSIVQKCRAKNEPLPLVVSPRTCVYRSRALQALEQAQMPWEIVFTSPSYTGTLMAVKAGLGITILPKLMIPFELHPIQGSVLPKLEDTHISLLKQEDANLNISLFEKFLIGRLKK